MTVFESILDMIICTTFSQNKNIWFLRNSDEYYFVVSYRSITFYVYGYVAEYRSPSSGFYYHKKIMFDGWQGTINWKHTCADKQTISDMICCESYTF